MTNKTHDEMTEKVKTAYVYRTENYDCAITEEAKKEFDTWLDNVRREAPYD